MKHDLKALRALCDAATAIDPQTVRALIDEIERKDAALYEAREALKLHGTFAKFHIKEGACVDINLNLFSTTDLREKHKQALTKIKQALGENDE